MNNISDITKQLAKFNIFENLTASERKQIAPLISYHACAEKELVFAEGGRSNEIFLVNEGVFDISVQSDQEEVSVASFSEGDIFGEMAFFDQHPRSAACRARVSGQVFVLDRTAFSTFQEKNPEACVKILKNLYKIITHRLRSSDSFLSDMVQWGETARKRSITDAMTGLFNRRYFDDFLDTIIFDAHINGTEFIMVMMDIDSFGDINRDFGSSLADECIVMFANAIKNTLHDTDTAARYGGDEFIAIFSQSTIEDVSEVCSKLRAELARQRTQTTSPLKDASFTVSQGIALFPHHANTKEEIFVAADAALYSAKKAGKNRAAVFDETMANLKTDKTAHFSPMSLQHRKQDIPTIAKRNKIINNITNALLHRESFLIVGHKDCDEDCFGSALALALLLRQLQKEVVVCMTPPIGERGVMLKNVCMYNEVTLLPSRSTSIISCDTVIICDTAKPDLLDAGPNIKARISDTSVLKIEFDHHLGADSRYIGTDGYCFVQQATSTCEIILLLCLKLQTQQELLERLRIANVLTRNISLALAIGILTDTQNGRLIVAKKEKKFLTSVLNILDQQLVANTFDKKKATSIADLIKIGMVQSPIELSLQKYFMRRVKKEPRLHYAVMHRPDSLYLNRSFEHALVKNASRTIADQLAEDSGFFGMTGYIEQGTDNTLVQCRVRRHVGYCDFDLRLLLEWCNIENGGGHEGAIGFRFPYQGKKHTEQIIAQIIEALHRESA